MKLHPEHLLSSKLNKDDRKTFQTIFISYHGVLCAFALKYLHDKQDAQDIVQEAFIALRENRHRFSSDTPLKSFLYLTVKNKCLNLL